MAGSFVPPTADLGAAAVPGLTASIPTTQPEPVAHTIPAAPGQPRPVAPAEDIGVPPAKALDAVAEPSLLDRVSEVTKPYISKIQETTKPYVDAAEHKAEQLFAKIDNATGASGVPNAYPVTAESGTAPSAAYAAGPDARSAPAGAPGGAGSEVGEIGEKAKQIFGQGLATVTSTFNQITHTLDEKTKSDTHPGIVSQATSAFEKGVHKVDDFLNEKTATPQTQPVQTTTNTVPHPEASASTDKPAL